MADISDALTPLPIDPAAWPAVAGGCPQRLEFRVVERPDGWLEAAYRLMAEEFDADVLDPLETYVESLELNQKNVHPFPLLMLAAFLRDADAARVVGVISGNLMRLPGGGPAALEPEKKPRFIYAIGHQTTARAIRASARGIGRGLWQAAADEAVRRAGALGGELLYSVLEAQAESVGFWDRLGYRWPHGVSYWQPPLQFDVDGRFVYPEVPELLMLKPLGEAAPDSIARELLLAIIDTIYQNWSLSRYRRELNPEALARAERYVMGEVFGRICDRMPAGDPIALVRGTER